MLRPADLNQEQRHILRAMAAGIFLRDLRDIEGGKSYALHPLDGPAQTVSGDAVHALVDAGLISSNKKFPGATYWLTDAGKAWVALDDVPAFALIPSPLTGPGVWALVAHELARRGHRVLIANPVDEASDGRAFWQQHAESVASAINQSAIAQPLVLAGHSGAGPLLPAIAARLAHPPTRIVFVDAGIGRAGWSRLDLLRDEGGAWFDAFEQDLRAGGAFPAWTNSDLADVIPNAALRQQTLRELRPRTLNFFVEKMSAPQPNAPCAYIQFSAGYAQHAHLAEQRGWPVTRFEAGHFHMLVDPSAVAQALIETQKADAAYRA